MRKRINTVNGDEIGSLNKDVAVMLAKGLAKVVMTNDQEDFTLILIPVGPPLCKCANALCSIDHLMGACRNVVVYVRGSRPDWAPKDLCTPCLKTWLRHQT